MIDMANDIERLRRAINDTKATAEGLQDIAGGSTRLTGEFLLKSSGEKKIVLNFPVACLLYTSPSPRD